MVGLILSIACESVLKSFHRDVFHYLLEASVIVLRSHLFEGKIALKVIIRVYIGVGLVFQLRFFEFLSL